ncbi:hypothetical protein [Zooshikella ganghwensis]|uniref:DUF1311 domain-containing protein n=1 Tax=Zooshikella ganghwensis TaxID=202772 RepID=A0A4P9VGD1_9GAMM|nr:hypothetical protein [Zooshikella ganghwensis]RDH41330.1 hypothetical protein B9G39_29105 [Zooshikella ganghwensis]
MYKSLFLSIIVVSVSNICAANKSVIDDYQLEREALSDKLDKQCKYSKDGGVEKLYQCKMQALKKLNEKMPSRGTDEYCERHYNKLTKVQAKELIADLRRSRDVARSSIFRRDGERGEVFEEDLDSEVYWLRKNILKEKLMMYDDRGF